LSNWENRDVVIEFLTRGTYRVKPPFKRKPDERYDFAVWSNPYIAMDDQWSNGVNLILISIDTVRADHVSCYGYEKETTPHLDALAQDSILFEQAITPAPWTLPAHASLFTGLTPSQHGVQNFHQTLSDAALTLAEVLRKESFLTMGVASFEYLFPDFGLAQGFDRYYFQYPLRAEKVVEKAVDMLDDANGKRFFMFLHFFDPHDPYSPPAPYDTVFAPSEGAVKVGKEHRCPVKNFIGQGRRPTDFDIEAAISLYDGEIRFVDEQLSFLFEKLKAIGIWSNTMVIVTSDHGEEFWDHGSLSHGFRLFEEQIHVPLIVKLPHFRDAGVRIARQVGLIDIMPTVLSELEIQADLGGQGRSLLIQPDTGPSFDDFYISETAAHGMKRLCLRSEILKYISPNCYNYKGLSFRSNELLYDLRNDPNETESLIGPEPDLARSLRRQAFEEMFALKSPGWRILFSTERPQAKFSGRIETDGRLKNLYSLACLDEKLDHDKHEIAFSKTIKSYESFFNFQVEPWDATLQIEIEIDDNSSCLERISVFPGGEHPATNPFQASAKDIELDIDALLDALDGRGEETGALVFYIPGEGEECIARSVGSIEIDERRREALRALGYMR
ncbi:MAG: sulfatase, partial [Candidatus Coatesbacteria bacterium]|nr:sulfatase [Candidatus Coatesbacteria bacterium]